MALSVRPRAVIWPALSTIFFAVAVYLIHLVESFPGPDKAQVQIVGVFADPSPHPVCDNSSIVRPISETSSPDNVSIRYATSDAETSMTFELPAGSFVILVNNLKEKSCQIAPQPHDMSELIRSPQSYAGKEIHADQYSNRATLACRSAQE